MSKLKWLNLAMRASMEVAIVVALATWGYHVGPTATTKALLAVVVPTIGFGIWGAVDFRRAGRFAEPLRLVEELLLSGLAAAAWYASGWRLLGSALALVSIAHHALVYLDGGRLLKQTTETHAGLSAA